MYRAEPHFRLLPQAVLHVMMFGDQAVMRILLLEYRNSRRSLWIQLVSLLDQHHYVVLWSFFDQA